MLFLSSHYFFSETDGVRQCE